MSTYESVANLREEIKAWLFREAELLDDGLERIWLEDMVSRDIIYQLPLRQTVERARGAGWVEGTFHLDERYGSFVTNVRPVANDDGTVSVRSNLLIYRTRQDNVVPQLLSGERHDLLRREDGVLRLLVRKILLDMTAIGTHNLSIFF